MQVQMTSEEVSSARGQSLQIERRTASDLPYKSFLNEYVASNRPVIIEDSAPGWRALQTWTPDFFKSRYGSKEVEVTYGVRQKLGEVIDAVLASTYDRPGPYLHRVIIHHHMPELLADLSPGNIYAFPGRYASSLMPRRFRRPDGYLKLLIGGAGGKFPLMHFDSDNANAAITEIYGDKEFVLFAPPDSRFVYPSAPGSNASVIDDLERPDYVKFPLFERATAFQGVIRPGDTIFVPSGWWHSARVVTTSISVCSNMLHAPNWSGFINECCRPQSGGWVARKAKRFYLGTAGATMVAAERLQRKFPMSPFASRLAKLSPAWPGGGPT
jgi:Cupin-like domain